jgi:sugar phosphate isomerase/epimerase
MIQLSYSTFGLTGLNLMDAIDAVDRAGYPGVELSFHRDQFNPFDLTPESVAALRGKLASLRVRPACVSTASHFFTPSRPHEPSLLCPDLAGRKRRIDLVRRGIELARALEVPLVTFGSGFIREEHIRNPAADPHALLLDSVRRCLDALRPGDGITLLIEPEPGMFIETTEQGLRLVEEVGSRDFRLHLDLCHMYCSEHDFAGSLARAAPFARFLHVSDARQGYNLKIIPLADEMNLDLEFAAYLVYFPWTAEYLLVDRDHPAYFFDERPGSRQRAGIGEVLRSAGIRREPEYVAYDSLHAGATPFDDEIFTYLISVPGLSFDVLERARPILIFLRTPREPGGKPLVDRMIANTLTGIVHFHEIPGEGTLDFGSAFRTLSENGFDGYASVELYHHVQAWEKALGDSYRHLEQFVA